MKNFIRTRLSSFSYAFQGVAYVLRNEANAWIHAIFTIFVILLAIWFRLSIVDWAILVLTIAMVWTAEFFNTAIESVINLVSPQEHPIAKIGKDVSAAAVLIAALTSIMIGLLILGPPLFEKITLLLQ